MTAWERRMQAALLDAADQFARYADYHLAKQPPDREKAATNVECAALCRKAATAPDEGREPMTEQPDTTTMSGAEFQRHAGTSAARWAEALVAAYDREGVHKEPRETRALFVEVWLRDYAEVRVAEEVGRVTARLVPRHDE